MAKEINIVVRDDDSALQNRISSLEKALQKKNDNSFILNEIKSLRKLVDDTQDKTEDRMAFQLKQLDSRLGSIFKMVSSRIDDVSKNSDKTSEIKELIAANSKTLMNKINSKDVSSLKKNLENIENALEMALMTRPTIINTTHITRGSSVVPFPA